MWKLFATDKSKCPGIRGELEIKWLNPEAHWKIFWN